MTQSEQPTPDVEVDDGFEEILRETPQMLREPCTLVCTHVGSRKGNKQAKRVSITFRASLLPRDVIAVLDGPRFAIAYNQSSCTIRLRACDDGQHALTRAPMGRHRADGAEQEKVYLLRFPFPAKGMTWCDVRTTVECDANEEQRVLLIDLPPAFRPTANAPRLTPPPKTAAAPPPPQSPVSSGALSGVAARAVKFPVRLGRIELEALEARLLGALWYADTPLTRGELLTATRDPDISAARDGREPQLIDRLVQDSRTRLSRVGLAIMNDSDGCYRLSPMHRQKLREILIDQGHEA